MKNDRQDGDKPKPDAESVQSAGEEDGLSPEVKIRQLEHELACVKQEME